jgi:hypothetical protein
MKPETELRNLKKFEITMPYSLYVDWTGEYNLNAVIVALKLNVYEFLSRT